MSKYSLFNDSISDDVKDLYQEEYAQTAAVLDAANLISEAMEEKGINQTELARMLGVSRGYVSRLLSGNENMSIKNVARVLFKLGKKYKQTVIAIETNNDYGKVISFKDYTEKVADIDKRNITTKSEPTTTQWDTAI